MRYHALCSDLHDDLRLQHNEVFGSLTAQPRSSRRAIVRWSVERTRSQDKTDIKREIFRLFCTGVLGATSKHPFAEGWRMDGFAQWRLNTWPGLIAHVVMSHSPTVELQDGKDERCTLSIHERMYSSAVAQFNVYQIHYRMLVFSASGRCGSKKGPREWEME